MAAPIAVLVVLLASTADAGQGISIGGGQGKPKRLKGVISAMGTFTPGATIAVSVRRMPKRARGLLFYGGVPGSPRCDEALTVCTLESLPTSRKWETSGQGKGTLTFSMPSHFTVFVSSSSRRGRYEDRILADGQPVKFVLLVARLNRNDQLVTGIAATKISVDIPSG